MQVLHIRGVGGYLLNSVYPCTSTHCAPVKHIVQHLVKRFGLTPLPLHLNTMRTCKAQRSTFVLRFWPTPLPLHLHTLRTYSACSSTPCWVQCSSADLHIYRYISTHCVPAQRVAPRLAECRTLSSDPQFAQSLPRQWWTLWLPWRRKNFCFSSLSVMQTHLTQLSVNPSTLQLRSHLLRVLTYPSFCLLSLLGGSGGVVQVGFWSTKKWRKDTFFPPSIPFPR